MTNVVIDAVSARVGGGQTYLRGFLASDPPGDVESVTVLAPATLQLPKMAARIRRRDLDARVASPWGRALWYAVLLPRLLRELKADVLFSPGGTVPARVPFACTRVTMSRNMLPFDTEQRSQYPLNYIRFRLALLSRVLMRSMQRADLVIFPSQFARDVVSARSDSALHSVVIPHGVSDQFRTPPEDCPNWLPDSYLVYVSNIEPYKSQLAAIEAFAIARATRPGPEKLLFVGPLSAPWYAERLRQRTSELGLIDDVVFTGPVDYRDLPAVYANAAVGLFMSACENCPNALLEGMATGRAMVVSNRPPMPEFAADAVLYADPARPDDIAAAMNQLLDDADRRAALGEAARRQVSHLRWSDTAAATWRAIASLERANPARAAQR